MEISMKLEGQIRIPPGCAIAAVISREGLLMSGKLITNAMKPMHDRSTIKDCESFLKEYFEIIQSEIIPTHKTPKITDESIIWRYFVTPLKPALLNLQLDEKDFVVRTVMKINTDKKGAYVFSSLLITGPFSIVFGFNKGLMALNNHPKLRSMVVG